MPQCQFLFSAVFVFQKSYIGNILGIGRNEARSSYFPDTRRSPKQRRRRARRQPHHLVVRPRSGRARVWCGPLVHPLTSPFRLYNSSDAKTLNQSASIHKKFHSAAVIEDQFWGTPCWDGELPPEPSPSTPLISLKRIYNF
jgi:hypothetical protein